MIRLKPYFLPCFIFAFFMTIVGCFRYFSIPKKVQYNIQDALTTCNVVPIVIIGGGPAGLSASIYITRFGIPCLLFDEIYTRPAQDIYCDPDWPGLESGEFGDRVLEMRQQTVHLGTTLVNAKIKEVDFTHWPFTLKDEQDRTFKSMIVIIATGSNKRKPNSELFKNQIDLTSSGYIKLQERMYATSRLGVFAAGSVYAECNHPIIVAAEGASAAIDAKVFLYELGYSLDVQAVLNEKMFVKFSA